MSSLASPASKAANERIGFAAPGFDGKWGAASSLFFLAVAYLPVLYLYLTQLWIREYYRFFPFAFLTTVVFASSRCGGLSRSHVSWKRVFVRTVVLVGSIALLVGGWSLGTPWPCFVSFVLAGGLLLDFWSDTEAGGSLTYTMLPIALVVRPPLNLDEILQWLQLHTSRFASSVLYAWRVDHILSGNKILPVTGKSLFVEEACSGVQSLFTVLFIAAFLIVSRRYPLLRGMLLLATAVFWALMMNVFRVVIIAWGQVRWGVDLAHGWQHEAVGYAGVGGAILLLLSADRLLAFLFGGIPDDPRVNASINPLVALWNRLLIPRDLVLTAETADADPDTAVSTSRMRAFAAPLMVVAVLFVAGLPAYANLDFTGASRSDIAEIPALQSVGTDWLPAETFASCKVLSFRSEHRSATSVFGACSEEWVVESPVGSILHSIDHPFSGWHNLAACYEGVGWQLRRLRPVDSMNSGEAWPVMFAEFSMPTGERALLCYSEFSVEGKPTPPVLTNRATTRFLARWKGIEDRPVQTIQVQSLMETYLPSDGPTRDELMLFHEQVREAAFRKITGSEPPAREPVELPQSGSTSESAKTTLQGEVVEQADATGEPKP